MAKALGTAMKFEAKLKFKLEATKNSTARILHPRPQRPFQGQPFVSRLQALIISLAMRDLENTGYFYNYKVKSCTELKTATVMAESQLYAAVKVRSTLLIVGMYDRALQISSCHTIRYQNC